QGADGRSLTRHGMEATLSRTCPHTEWDAGPSQRLDLCGGRIHRVLPPPIFDHDQLERDLQRPYTVATPACLVFSLLPRLASFRSGDLRTLALGNRRLNLSYPSTHFDRALSPLQSQTLCSGA